MSKDFIPKSDDGKLLFSANFSQAILNDAEALGLTQAQADSYALLQSQYKAALQAANTPETRTAPSVQLKNTLRSSLVDMTRALARIVQACPIVTDVQRTNLALPVHRRTSPPIARPMTTPEMRVLGVEGRRVTVELYDHEHRRLRPAGVAGANVRTFVGEHPSRDINDWKFEFGTAQRKFTIEFPLDVSPGSKVWISAAWYNPRGESGPAATPAQTWTQFGGCMSTTGLNAA